jgi:tripartite motif-containing protein 71
VPEVLTRRRLLGLVGAAAALTACIGPGSGAPAGQGAAAGQGAPAAEKRPDAAPAAPSAAFQASEAQAVVAVKVLLTLSGPGQGDPFKGPSGVTVDADDNLYVADVNNKRICKFDKDGKFLLLIEGELQTPVDVAAGPDGRLWVLDRATGSVISYTRDGQPLGKFTGPGFYGPFDVAADASSVYVADSGTGRVIRFSPDGEVKGELLKRSAEATSPKEPTGLTFDPDGTVVVLDGAANRLTRVSPDGKVLASFDAVAQGMARVVRMPDGSYLVTDSNRGRLLRWDGEGKLLARYGTQGEGEGQFRVPSGLALTKDGHVWVSDVSTSRVQKVALE